MTDARACAICGVSLAGRRRHARYCSGACRARASRRSRKSALDPSVRFPGSVQGGAAGEALGVYGSDAGRAAILLASRSSEPFLRGMTQFHLRKRGRPSDPDDVAAVIASLRRGTPVADSSAGGKP